MCIAPQDMKWTHSDVWFLVQGVRTYNGSMVLMSDWQPSLNEPILRRHLVPQDTDNGDQHS